MARVRRAPVFFGDMKRQTNDGSSSDSSGDEDAEDAKPLRTPPKKKVGRGVGGMGLAGPRDSPPLVLSHRAVVCAHPSSLLHPRLCLVRLWGGGVWRVRGRRARGVRAHSHTHTPSPSPPCPSQTTRATAQTPSLPSPRASWGAGCVAPSALCARAPCPPHPLSRHSPTASPPPPHPTPGRGCGHGRAPRRAARAAGVCV